MATPIKMYKGSENNIENLDIVDGQLIFTTDEKNIYLDDKDERKSFISTGNDSYVSLKAPEANNSDVWFVIDGPAYEIVDFATGTDEQIAAMLEAHYEGLINIEDYWHVGDTRLIHLNGIASPNKDECTNPWPEQDITIVITALNTYDLNEPIGIRDKAAVIVQTREVLNNMVFGYDNLEGEVFVNLSKDKDTTFIKWSNLPLKLWMNNQFLTTCFSQEMQNMIKEIKHNRLANYTGTATEEVIEKVFLPSYTEVFGNVKNNHYLDGIIPAGEEGAQWEYYTIYNNRSKDGNDNGKPNGEDYAWWMGSPQSYISNVGYCWSIVTGGSANGNYGHRTEALAPAWCI